MSSGRAAYAEVWKDVTSWGSRWQVEGCEAAHSVGEWQEELSVWGCGLEGRRVGVGQSRPGETDVGQEVGKAH